MRDVLGWRRKFGVLGPSTNTIVQPDFEMMRPAGVTNHYSRIFTPNAQAVSNDNRYLAYTFDTTGFREYTLAIKDLVTGKMLPDSVKKVNSPTWSADGKRIAFSSNRDGVQALYSMKADGTDIKRMDGIESFYLRYSPDGKKIAFISGKFPNTNVVVANADGSSPINITGKK